MESTTIVIKVKYGETLRRFNAHVNEAGQLDIDMGGLREKAVGLFNFDPDVDLTLTYIDEDGDVVTLVNEEDLHDVMRQSLNPLRITVKLNAEKGGRSYTRSSGTSTPMRSPGVQHPLPNLNSGVSEMLKYVPEPFSEVISKLPLEFASRAALSDPMVAELANRLSKLEKAYIKPLSEFQVGTESSTPSGAPGSAVSASMTMAKEPEASKYDGSASEVMPNAKYEKLTCKTNQKVDLEKGTKGVGASDTPVSGSMNLNASLPGGSFLSGCLAAKLTHVASHDAVCESKEQVKKLGECHLSGQAADFGRANFLSVASNFPASDNKEFKKSNRPWKSAGAGAGASASSAGSMRHSTMDFNNSNLGGNASTTFPSLNLINQCPFSGMPVASDSTVPSAHYVSRVPPFKKSYNQNEGMGSIFHMGVRCDGCGVNPITGLRFKSKVKEDYDLCSICFSGMGNEADYIRIDCFNQNEGMGSIFHKGVCCDGCGVHPITGLRFKSKVKENYDLCSICFSGMGNEADYIRIDCPVPYRHPYSFKGLYDPIQHPRLRPPTPPDVLRGHGMKPSRPKLESRFIMDVNVLDGTIMAPSTPFTKIWRMRNNGSIVWPQGTQLVWIGGDKLGNALPVELQISSDGLPVENELDVAVDFIAPELPGRYISYWRMASPSGKKFGQRVWVLIQIDASLKDALCDSFNGLNLNLPPDSSVITGPEMVYVNVEPMVVEDSLPEPNNTDRASDLPVPIVEAHQNKDQELNFPINDTLLVGGGVSNHVTSGAPTSVSYPIVDLSEVAPVVPSHVAAPSTYVPASAQGVSEISDVEKTLLRELEVMGFRQVDLNKEILRMNEYNLEQSVDDLCGVAEWDPILEELQEMGFCDKEMNKVLLKKNNGSIKRVVMELIAGEKV